MTTVAKEFEAATFRRLVAAHEGADIAPGTRIAAGSLIAESEQGEQRENVVQLAGHMRYPTPRTVSTNRT